MPIALQDFAKAEISRIKSLGIMYDVINNNYARSIFTHTKILIWFPKMCVLIMGLSIPKTQYTILNLIHKNLCTVFWVWVSNLFVHFEYGSYPYLYAKHKFLCIKFYFVYCVSGMSLIHRKWMHWVWVLDMGLPLHKTQYTTFLYIIPIPKTHSKK